MMSGPTIGVLALQGCVTAHRQHLEALGANYREIRTSSDCKNIDGYILPGGESSTMLKIMDYYSLKETLLTEFSLKPTWGICAGSILMAKTILNVDQYSFNLMDMEIERNGYGSQLQSFEASICDEKFFFIRAPRIIKIDPSINVLASYDGSPVWVQKDKYMATTFHPELSTKRPSKMHKYFIELCLP